MDDWGDVGVEAVAFPVLRLCVRLRSPTRGLRLTRPPCRRSARPWRCAGRNRRSRGRSAPLRAWFSNTVLDVLVDITLRIQLRRRSCSLERPPGRKPGQGTRGSTACEDHLLIPRRCPASEIVAPGQNDVTCWDRAVIGPLPCALLAVGAHCEGWVSYVFCTPRLGSAFEPTRTDVALRTVRMPARPSAALELRRSLHARQSRRRRGLAVGVVAPAGDACDSSGWRRRMHVQR